MLEDDRVAAARNNAGWCDIVCGSHGLLRDAATLGERAAALRSGGQAGGSWHEGEAHRWWMMK
ncbi:hypothetical protein [Micromonospora arborensis]|uniref:hypothetical protein n=1 Tax=Micromonospora arborensis TaxID=2116518 RepID=UPI0011B35CA6|nr:hypothetical protein [Micromonospora arborensis]